MNSPFRHSSHNSNSPLISYSQKIFSESALTAYRILQLVCVVLFTVWMADITHLCAVQEFGLSAYWRFVPMIVTVVTFYFATFGARRHSKILQSFFNQDT